MCVLGRVCVRPANQHEKHAAACSSHTQKAMPFSTETIAKGLSPKARLRPHHSAPAARFASLPRTLTQAFVLNGTLAHIVNSRRLLPCRRLPPFGESMPVGNVAVLKAVRRENSFGCFIIHDRAARRYFPLEIVPPTEGQNRAEKMHCWAAAVIEDTKRTKAIFQHKILSPGCLFAAQHTIREIRDLWCVFISFWNRPIFDTLQTRHHYHRHRLEN